MKKFLAPVLAALILSSPAWALQAPKAVGGNIQVPSINPGFGNHFRAGSFFPVAVEMSARFEPASGTITVRPDSGGPEVPLYVTPFDLSPGTPYRYFVYPYCADVTDSYTLTIRDARGVEVRREELLMDRRDDLGYYVAIIGGQHIPGIVKRAPAEDACGLDTGFVSLDFLPPRARGYEPADTIIWPHPDPAELKTENAEALREWVLAGGRIVLCIGDGWQAAASAPLLKALLPGSVTGMDNTGDFDGLAALGGAPIPADRQMGVAVLSNPRGDIIARAGALPLVVREKVGFGEVIFLAFDPTRSPFALWDGAERFWARLLGLAAPRPKAGPAGGSNPPAAYYSRRGYRSSLGLENRLVAEMNTFPEIKPISFAFVVVFLLVYVLAVGPVDYFVLKRLRHLEWTWFTFPAVALAATVVAFAVIASGRASRVYVNQLTISDWNADGQAERHYSLSAIISPRNDHYQVSYNIPDSSLWLAQGGRDSLRGGFSALTVTQYTVLDRPDSGMTVSDVLMPVWLPRTFCARWSSSAPSAPPLTAKLASIGPRLVGRVTNVGAADVRGVMLVDRTGAYKLGDIKAGASAEVTQVTPVSFEEYLTAAAAPMRSADYMVADSRPQLYKLIEAISFGKDERYYPTDGFLGALAAGEYGGNAAYYDLPPELSVRSLVDSGQAVIIARADVCAVPVATKIAQPLKRDITFYRVCLRVSRD